MAQDTFEAEDNNETQVFLQEQSFSIQMEKEKNDSVDLDKQADDEK